MLSKEMSLWDLLILLRDSKSMASFGYFDESDTHEGTFWTVVAGALAVPEAWLAVEKPWKQVLRGFGVSAFHATDFAHSRGEFRGWDKDEAKRRRFLASLFDAIEGKTIVPTYTCVRNDEFEDVKSQFPEQRRSRYDICCEILLGQLGQYATDRRKFDPISVVLHAGQKIKSDYLRSFLDGEEMERRMAQFHIDSVTRKRKGTPLQLADWIAYEMRCEFYRVSTQSARAMRFPLKQLAQQHGWPTGSIIDRITAMKLFEAEHKMRQTHPHK